MCAGAEALIILTDMDHSHHIGGIIGKTTEVKTGLRLLLRYKLLEDLDVGVDNSVDVSIQFLDLLRGEGHGEVVVEFRLFSFDMGFESSAAVKTACHFAVEDMFSGVHGRVLLLVVGV